MRATPQLHAHRTPANVRKDYFQNEIGFVNHRDHELATPALDAFCSSVCAGTEWVVAQLWVRDGSDGLLHCVNSWHQPKPLLRDFCRTSEICSFVPGLDLTGRAWKSRQVEWSADFSRELSEPRAPVAARAGLRCAFAIPVVRLGECVAVVEFFSPHARELDDGVAEFMAAAVNSSIPVPLRRHRVAS